jgi:glutathione reductase (NADPH)
MTEAYDLFVIGGGSGGVAAARRASALGAKVALAERGRLGGTCVMRGCVPKKLMMYAAQFGIGMREAAAFGWQIDAARFDMAVWQARKTAELLRLEEIYRTMLSSAGVTLLRGAARLNADGGVSVDDVDYATKRILIATGGRPASSAFPGLDLAMTSDDLLDLRSVPARLAIVGAGYIGMEFACIMASLGSAVSVFYREGLPLRGFDGGIRESVVEALPGLGIQLFPETKFERIERNGEQFSLAVNGAAQTFDAILNATGRHPNTEGLGLAERGIAVASNGAIPVDAWSRTATTGIFAIGDVTNRKNLTPVAIAEGRAVAENEFNGGDVKIEHDKVASAAFTIPPIGAIGLSEDEAKAHGKLRIYEARFRSMKTAFAGGQQKVFMKVIVEDGSDRVLGIHMHGDDAAEIIQALAVAMRMGATKADLDRTIAVHPTIAEEFVLMRTVTRVVG